MGVALPIAVCIIRSKDEKEILLIRRIRGAYVGSLALPGGKIESNEHLPDAALRETLEETGINCSFLKYIGIVSELLITEKSPEKKMENKGKLEEKIEHFLLHICVLEAITTEITHDQEGKSEWYKIAAFLDDDKLKEEMIPSDYLILKHYITNLSIYFNHSCILVNSDSMYAIQQFKPFTIGEKNEE